MRLSNIQRVLLLPICICMLHANPLFAQQSLHVYSLEIPWRDTPPVHDSSKLYSLAQAISLAQSGDSIWVHEGIYREQLTVSKNNLFLGNYQGAYVLLTGAEKVDNWVPATGMTSGTLQANVASLGIEMPYSQLFVDGNAQMLARHPNNTTGHMMMPLDEHSGYSLLTSVEKDQGENANGYATFEAPLPNVDLSGGIFRGLTGKMRNYVFGNITASTSQTVTFNALNNGQWKNAPSISDTKHKAGWGFVMHKNLIDVPGEWFLDNNTLYYLPPSSAPIGNLRLEIQVREKVLTLNNAQNLTFSGINFIAGNVEILNSQSVEFEGCSWRYLQPFWVPNNYGDNQSEETGILIETSSNTAFKNCYLGHSWGNAFAILSGNNHLFENCVIEDIAWIGIFASAIYSRTGPITVRNCTFGDAGRFHLRLRSNDKIEVYDSDFYGAMMMGEDAGPIEATSTGSLYPLDLKQSVFAYNKVHDCHGIPVFDGGYNKQFVVAFYMEDSDNYTAHHNLVYNIRANTYTGPHNMEKAGAFLYLGPRYNYMSRPVNYYNNTVWDYDKCINIWHIEADNWEDLGMPEPGGGMEDGHFVNNIFQEGTSFKMNWTKQILTPTGGRVDWVSVANPPKIETTDWQAFVTHCQNQGYFFNASNTSVLPFADQNQNFTNVSQGDFNLLSTSPAKNTGAEIPGITSSTNPDRGALEGGNRVLNAGASLQTPDFKEVSSSATSIVAVSDKQTLHIYPNPTHSQLIVSSEISFAQGEVVQILSVEGKLVAEHLIEAPQNTLQLRVSHLPKGVYVLQRLGRKIEGVRFVKQ